MAHSTEHCCACSLLKQAQRLSTCTLCIKLFAAYLINFQFSLKKQYIILKQWGNDDVSPVSSTTAVVCKHEAGAGDSKRCPTTPNGPESVRDKDRSDWKNRGGGCKKEKKKEERRGLPANCSRPLILRRCCHFKKWSNIINGGLRGLTSCSNSPVPVHHTITVGPAELKSNHSSG